MSNNENYIIEGILSDMFPSEKAFVDISNRHIRQKYVTKLQSICKSIDPAIRFKTKILNAILDIHECNYVKIAEINPDAALNELGLDWWAIASLYKAVSIHSFTEGKEILKRVIAKGDEIKYKDVVVKSYTGLIEICAYSRDISETDLLFESLNTFWEKHNCQNHLLLNYLYALSYYYLNHDDDKCLHYIEISNSSSNIPIGTSIVMNSIKAKILSEQKNYTEEISILIKCIADYKNFIAEQVPLAYYIQLLEAYCNIGNLKEAEKCIQSIDAESYFSVKENQSVLGQYFQSKAKLNYLNGNYHEAISLIEKSVPYVKDTKMAVLKNKLLQSKCYALLNQGEHAVKQFEEVIQEYTEYFKEVQQNKISELEIKHDTLKKNEEIKQLRALDEFKKRFFTNITHDIRTPISLILAPLEDSIINSTNTTTKYSLQLAYSNAKKLEYFLDQLLDLNKIEEGLLKPQYVFGNINQFCSSVTQSLLLAGNILFSSQIATADQDCYFDTDALSKIIHNLVSNAVKFSKADKPINIKLQRNKDNIILSVKDQGIGIAEEQLQKIFDRFYQINSEDNSPSQGTGIGLSIVKEYAHLLGGQITVNSKLNKGSTFSVILPYKTALAPKDVVSTHKAYNQPNTRIPILNTSEANPIQMENSRTKETLLITEDNEELLYFLKIQLEDDYNIIEAYDGEEGWQKAKKHMPSLIISDIMMPKMDGITFCNMVKTNQLTNHIPVILLSAKNSIDTELVGYGVMADAYVKKPFNLSVLKATIQTIISNRNKQSLQVMNAIRNDLVNKLNIDTNNEFINQFYQIIEKHIYSSTINVDKIAKEMNMNRVTLLRKVKHFTGKTTKDVIMEIRLNNAKFLLEKRESTVKDIAYKLGFVNLDNFYKSYKKRFGITPASTKTIK